MLHYTEYHEALPPDLAAGRRYRDGLHLRVAGDGAVGSGDAAAWPSAPIPDVDSLIEVFTRRPPSPDSVASIRSWSAESGLSSPLRFGAETALLDLLGQCCSQPVFRLLAPMRSPSGPVMVTRHRLVGRSSDACETSLFKIKCDFRSESSIERVAGHALRYPHAKLRIDANQSGDRKSLTRLLRLVPGGQIDFIEEPAPASDIDCWRLVTDAGVRGAVDESLWRDSASAWQKLDSGIATVAIVKPMFVGGVFAALDMVARLRGLGTEIVVTTALETAVGAAAVTHIVASVVGQVAPSGISYVGKGPGWLDGDPIEVPACPGLGLQVTT